MCLLCADNTKLDNYRRQLKLLEEEKNDLHFVLTELKDYVKVHKVEKRLKTIDFAIRELAFAYVTQ